MSKDQCNNTAVIMFVIMPTSCHWGKSNVNITYKSFTTAYLSSSVYLDYDCCAILVNITVWYTENTVIEYTRLQL